MKKLLAVLVAFGLVTAVCAAASGQSEPFINECHDLDDGQIPEGWTQELWYGGPGVYEGALRAFPNDGLGKLWKQGVLPDGAVGIRFEYDGNIAYSYWGIINQILIELSSGVAYLVRSEMSDIHNGMVTTAKIVRFDGGSEVPDMTYQWDYPFETTGYHYTATFYDGLIEYKAEKLDDGSILFDLSVEDPYLDISTIETIAFMVRAKTDNKAWMDNLCVEIIGGGPFCDEFDGTSLDLSLWDPLSGSWNVSAGRLNGYWPISAADRNGGILVFTDPFQPTGDFTFEVDMVVETPATGNRTTNGGKIELWNSYQNRIFVDIDVESPDDFVRGYVGGSGFVICPYEPNPPIKTSPGEINHIVLERSGEQYCVFLNGYFLCTFQDSYFGGDTKLGLGTYGSCTFENVCLTYESDGCDVPTPICEAFLTPRKVSIKDPDLARANPRGWNYRGNKRHSFKIHLLPCDPLDISVGDSAEVSVDVDASGVFDDDEHYPAVVSSTDRDGEATDIAIKVFVGADLIDNDPIVAIYSVGGQTIVDADGNPIDYLQLDTFTPGHQGLAAGEGLMPTNCALEQNYPNPFNASTVIRFSLPTPSDWFLRVYNVAGQLIEEFRGSAESGFVTVNWDATDAASGIYFYKLTAGSFTETRKMILMK